LTAEALPEIAGICRDLDGIPLAIEFAAARVATLGVNSVATGLRDRFALFTSGRRGAPARHRTLRATLDWSYGLLSGSERTLLRRLAVFAGGFTIEAATSVMQDSGLDQAALVDGVSNLVAKSLVSLGTPATDRWRLLETIRTYALEKLVEHGEADTAARHHATYFRDLVTSLAPGTRLSLPADEFTRCVREIDNVRAALDWSFSPGGDAAVGIALTAAYVPVWSQATLVVECRERTERALSRLDPGSRLDERARLRLHMGSGLAAIFTVQPVEWARTILGTAVDIAERLEDLDTRLWATWGLWMAHFYSGDCHAAFSLTERLAAVASRIGEPFALITSDRHIGNTLHHLGDQPQAQMYLERAIERSVTPAARQNSMYPQVDQRVFARAYLARVLLLRGYPDQATEQARSSLEEAIATGYEPLICQALRLAICPVALMTGDLTAAERDIARLADIADAFSAPFWKTAARSFEGKLAIMRGKFERGTTLVRAELDASERTGWTNWYPEFLGVYAEGLSGLGRFSEAVAAIDQALVRADQGGERYHLAELLRLKGEFLLARSGGAQTTAIDDCFHAALTIARQQGALFFELRAALSVARWRLRQERHAEAKHNLPAVYDRFTEGFGTADLRAAKALLDDLPT
jgi:predicted ATPase